MRTQFLVPALGGSGPSPRRHLPLPPFDASDEDGIVHTTLPDGVTIPAHGADPLFPIGDFNGVTLDLDRWTPKAPMPLPRLEGANTTPLAMLMTPMLVMYPPYWQEATFVEHAERDYDTFVVSANPWNAEENGFAYTPQSQREWCKRVRSWGFRVMLWQGGHPPDDGPNAMLQTLFDAGVVDFYIHGKEVDDQGYAHAEEYEASLAKMDQYIGGRIPIGVHFTANGEREMSYPIGADREYFLPDWSPYNGRVHLMLQSCPEKEVDGVVRLTSAGRQGASAGYAHRHVHLGLGDAAGNHGRGAPDSVIVDFETMATSQLYGRCTEEVGCLRSLELFCAIKTNGSCNGLRAPDGRSIRTWTGR